MSNTTQSTPDNSICIYPQSGIYAPLQRILFYILLTFGVLSRRQPWLSAGALTSAMTYAGSAAIHSIFLLTRARSPIVDLDTYSAFAVTSAGVLLVAPLLSWSTTLRSVEREVRLVILLWTGLVALGAVLAMVAVYLVQGSIAVGDGVDGGPSACGCGIGGGSVLFRSCDSVQLWEGRPDPARDITGVFLPTVAATLPMAIVTWVVIVCGVRGGEYGYLDAPGVLRRIELGRIWGLVSVWGKRGDDGDGGLFATGERGVVALRAGSIGSPKRPSGSSRQGTGRRKWVLAFQYYSTLGSFCVFVLNTVLNEVRFRELPTTERAYEVGQWSAWVDVALVFVAQMLIRIVKGYSVCKRRDEEDLQMGRRESVEMTRVDWTTSPKRRNSF